MNFKKLLKTVLLTGMVSASPIIAACKKTDVSTTTSEKLVDKYHLDWNVNQVWKTTVDQHNDFVSELNDIKILSTSSSNSNSGRIKLTEKLVLSAKKNLSESFPNPTAALELTQIVQSNYKFLEVSSFSSNYVLSSINLSFKFGEQVYITSFTWKTYLNVESLAKSIEVPPKALISMNQHNNVVDELTKLAEDFGTNSGSWNEANKLYAILTSQIFYDLPPLPNYVKLSMFEVSLPQKIEGGVNITNRFQTLKIRLVFGNNLAASRFLEFSWNLMQTTQSVMDAWNYTNPLVELSFKEHRNFLEALDSRMGVQGEIPRSFFFTTVSSVFVDFPRLPSNSRIFINNETSLKPKPENLGVKEGFNLSFSIFTDDQIPLERDVDLTWNVVENVDLNSTLLTDSTVTMSASEYDYFRTEFNSIVSVAEFNPYYDSHSYEQNTETFKSLKIVELMRKSGFRLPRIPAGSTISTRLPKLYAMTSEIAVGFNLQFQLAGFETNTAFFGIEGAKTTNLSLAWNPDSSRTFSIQEHDAILNVVKLPNSVDNTSFNSVITKLKPYFPDLELFSSDIKITSVILPSRVEASLVNEEVPVTAIFNLVHDNKTSQLTLGWRVNSKDETASNWVKPLRIRFTASQHNNLRAEFNTLNFNNLGSFPSLSPTNVLNRKNSLRTFVVLLQRHFRNVNHFNDNYIIAGQPTLIDVRSVGQIREHKITFGVLLRTATAQDQQILYVIEWESLTISGSTPATDLVAFMYQKPDLGYIDYETHNKFAREVNAINLNNSEATAAVEKKLRYAIFPQMNSFPKNSSIISRNKLKTYTLENIPTEEIVFSVNFNVDGSLLQVDLKWKILRTDSEAVKQWVSGYRVVSVAFNSFRQFRQELVDVQASYGATKFEKSEKISELFNKWLNLAGAILPRKYFIDQVVTDAMFNQVSGTFNTFLNFEVRNSIDGSIIQNPDDNTNLFKIRISTINDYAPIMSSTAVSIFFWNSQSYYLSKEAHNAFVREIRLLMSTYGNDANYSYRYLLLLNTHFRNIIGFVPVDSTVTISNSDDLIEIPLDEVNSGSKQFSLTIQYGSSQVTDSIKYNIESTTPEGFFVPNAPTVLMLTHNTLLSNLKRIVDDSSIDNFQKMEDIISRIKRTLYPSINLYYPDYTSFRYIVNYDQLLKLTKIDFENGPVSLSIMTNNAGIDKVVTYKYYVNLNHTDLNQGWKQNTYTEQPIIDSSVYTQLRNEWNAIKLSATKHEDFLDFFDKYFAGYPVENFENWGLYLNTTLDLPAIQSNGIDFSTNISFSYGVGLPPHSQTWVKYLSITVTFKDDAQKLEQLNAGFENFSSDAQPYNFNSHDSYVKFLTQYNASLTGAANDGRNLFAVLNTLAGFRLGDGSLWKIIHSQNATIPSLQQGLNITFLHSLTLNFTIQLKSNSAITTNVNIYLTATPTTGEVISIATPTPNTVEDVPLVFNYYDYELIRSYLTENSTNENLRSLVTLLRNKGYGEPILTSDIFGASHDLREPRNTQFGPFFSYDRIYVPTLVLYYNNFPNSPYELLQQQTLQFSFGVSLGQSMNKYTIKIKVKGSQTEIPAKWVAPSASNEILSVFEWNVLKSAIDEIRQEIPNSFSDLNQNKHLISKLQAVLIEQGYADGGNGFNFFDHAFILRDLSFSEASLSVRVNFKIALDTTSTPVDFTLTWKINRNQFYAESKIGFSQITHAIDYSTWAQIRSATADNLMSILKSTIGYRVSKEFFEIQPLLGSLKFDVEKSGIDAQRARLSFVSNQQTGITHFLTFAIGDKTSPGYTILPNLETAKNVPKKRLDELKNFLTAFVKEYGTSEMPTEISLALIKILGSKAYGLDWINFGRFFLNQTWDIVTPKVMNLRYEWIQRTSTLVIRPVISLYTSSGDLYDSISPTLKLVENSIKDYLDSEIADLGTQDNQLVPVYEVGADEYKILNDYFIALKKQSEVFSSRGSEIQSLLAAVSYTPVGDYLNSLFELKLVHEESSNFASTDSTDNRMHVKLSIVRSEDSVRQTILFEYVNIGLENLITNYYSISTTMNSSQTELKKLDRQTYATFKTAMSVPFAKDYQGTLRFFALVSRFLGENYLPVSAQFHYFKEVSPLPDATAGATLSFSGIFEFNYVLPSGYKFSVTIIHIFEFGIQG